MASAAQPINHTELVELAALDNNLYCQTFFPQTFRQKSPEFHTDIWGLLEDRAHRYVSIEVFRGGAKTTLLRTYTSKRIAYGTSRTILFVSEAQGASEKSIGWIKGQVMKKGIWAQVYGLEKGSKWTDEEIKIYNAVLGINITVKALGITGQVRGINVEDYRPDLIVVDDPCDEENTATPEQRKKTSDLFFGALEKSLSPASECPDAKLVLLQTPLSPEDLINQCHKDPQWASRKFGVFDEEGKSRWENRLPTAELLKAKEAHIARGQLGLWMREMECQIVAAESSDFREDWLQYYDHYELEDKLPKMLITLGLDPVPPPSERELTTGLTKKDWEVIAAVGHMPDGSKYILDICRSRGHTPEWTEATFFQLVDRWGPIKARIEGVAYQRTLKWFLEQAMQRRRRWVQTEAVTDKRAKSVRIRQAFSGIGAGRKLFVRREMHSFISQFISYPNVSHDDDLDGVAMALEVGGGWEGRSDDTPAGNGIDARPDDEVQNWRHAP